MLVSPHFLFRIEHDPNPTDPTEVHPISDVELASRLSYFLWSSMPDDELLDAGRSRQTARRRRARCAGEAHAGRSALRRARRQLRRASGWRLRNLDVVKPDPQKFPEWSPELRDAMKTETRLFFDHILRENRPLAEFLDARYTFLNERLAKYYGIDGVKGPDFRRVDLTTDQRGGILSQASVLTVSSYPTRTSVVIRGKYILQNILGSAAAASAARCSAARRSAVGTAASLRQQMEKHRADADLRLLPQQDGPARLRPGELRRHRQVAHAWTASSRWMPAARCPTASRSPRPAEMRALLKSQLPSSRVAWWRRC